MIHDADDASVCQIIPYFNHYCIRDNVGCSSDADLLEKIRQSLDNEEEISVGVLEAMGRIKITSMKN